MGITRYEPLITHSSSGESALTPFVNCKNDICLIVPNSRFIVPWLLSDKHRHQEED